MTTAARLLGVNNEFNRNRRARHSRPQLEEKNKQPICIADREKAERSRVTYPYDAHYIVERFRLRPFPRDAQHGPRTLCKCADLSGELSRQSTLQRTSDEIRRVRAKSAVPHPSLVALQDFLQSKLPVTTDRPNFDCRISRACGKISDDQMSKASQNWNQLNCSPYVRT